MAGNATTCPGHDVGTDLVKYLEQSIIDVARAVAQRLPGSVDANPSRRSIVGRRKIGAVSRMKSFQNWPGHFGFSGRGSAASAFFEALRLEVAGEALLDDEHGPVTTRLEDLSDADAVVRSERTRLHGKKTTCRPSGIRSAAPVMGTAISETGVSSRRNTNTTSAKASALRGTSASRGADVGTQIECSRESTP